jgi:hypothetical protein
MDLFAELQKAISDGNHEEVERIQRRILLGNRDESIDENFIKSIKGKTLGKNVSRIIDGKEFSDNDYMKIVSSLITHNIIESEQTGRPLKDYPIHELYVILGNFVNGGDGAVDECCRFVTERYSRFL